MVVADFDSGAGYYTFAASKLVGNSGKVYSIDPNEDMLSKIANEAKSQGIENIKIINSNIESTNGSKLNSELVDLVVIANTLFAVDDKRKVVEEAKRIIRKKGKVLVVEWKDVFAGIGPHRTHLVKQEDVVRIFEDKGFELEEEIDAGDHHYGLVFALKK